MAIYDTFGNDIHSAFRKNGGSLSSAYDVNGGLVFSNYEPDLTVMTYNVQWFTKINSQQAMQQAIIDEYDADIIGLQELSTNGSVPSLGRTVLSDYTLRLSNHKNYMAFASKITLSNVVIADFVNQDPVDASEYNETRAYMMADISVGGKTVKWINTHLAPNTASYRYLQMAEVFDLAEQSEYVVITGDFNCLCGEIGDAEYVNMVKPFVDAGYNVANCTQSHGITKTWTNKTSVTSLADFTYPTDNIIVSSNINILDIIYDLTKLSYQNGQPLDHVPIIARLLIH